MSRASCTAEHSEHGSSARRGTTVCTAWLVAALGVIGCAANTTTNSTPTAATQSRSAPTSTTPEPPAVNAPLTPSQIRAIVEAPDRDPADLEADERRRPVELLTFFELRPGMKVADLGAGLGYTTELLARAVGEQGVVYGQNPPFVLQRFAEKGWTERLAKPVNANVVRLDREFDDPFPPEVRDLDLVVNVLFYHDFEWQKVDRARHNAAVYHALKPGGRYVIIDSSAAEGAGVTGSETLHRIEEKVVRQELTDAGFELVAEGDFLRNPSDTRNWNALPWRNERDEYSDKFVLAFRKPLASS